MKQRLKHAAGLLLFLIGFLLIGQGLRCALYDDTNNEMSYKRFTFHDFYQQKDIDTLFVGSSHIFVSVNPAVMDDALGRSTFNIGRDTQTLDGSLLVIREAVKRYPIKHIYLDMFYGLGYTKRSQKWTQQEEIYATADYLRPSLSKYLYMLLSSHSEQYIYSFFPMRRNREELYDLDFMQNMIQTKTSEDFFNPALNETPLSRYVTKGFWTNSYEIKDWNFFENANHTYHHSINPESYIGGDWQEDLLKIIAFCKKNQIELTLFSAPMSDFQLASVNNYDDYIAIVYSLLEGTGISYWDFNLCREEYFPGDSALFYNRDHLNTKGAELFSSLFARFIQGEISPEELFYDSYAEKLRHLEPNVLGVVYLPEENAGIPFRNCRIISTSTEGMEFQISIQTAESEPDIIQDYEENTVFPLTENGAGKIVVRWRVKDHPEFIGERIIDFPEK